jgi:hypothetical protein
LNLTVARPVRFHHLLTRLRRLSGALLLASALGLAGTPASVAHATPEAVELAAAKPRRDGRTPGLVVLGTAALLVLVSRPVIPGRAAAVGASETAPGSGADHHR